MIKVRRTFFSASASVCIIIGGIGTIGIIIVIYMNNKAWMKQDNMVQGYSSSRTSAAKWQEQM
jgi:uncharacterized membrane protein